MKITFVGNFNVDFTSETHHSNTLQSMGHKVARLQEGQTSTDQILASGLSSDLVVWVHTHGWDTTGSISIADLSQRLRDANVPLITYHLDLWMGISRQADLDNEYYKALHHFFTVDKLMADYLNESTNTIGHFVPAAVYDKEVYIHQDYNPDSFDADVVFVGSRKYHEEWAYRPQLIDWLRQNYNFRHIGPDGEGVARGDALNRIYAKSKIAIGDTLNMNFNYPFYSSDRLWESIGRGAFTIYPRITGLESVYEEGKEVAYYEHGNFADLKEKIDYYLEHEEEREKIRLEGQYKTKTSGTYVNRWHQILGEL
jgi:hypothetical protein